VLLPWEKKPETSGQKTNGNWRGHAPSRQKFYESPRSSEENARGLTQKVKKQLKNEKPGEKGCNLIDDKEDQRRDKKKNLPEDSLISLRGKGRR